MRSFMERFAFMNISYNIYTMNGNKAQSKLFSYIYMMNTGILKKFGCHINLVWLHFQIMSNSTNVNVI